MVAKIHKSLSAWRNCPNSKNWGVLKIAKTYWHNIHILKSGYWKYSPRVVIYHLERCKHSVINTNIACNFSPWFWMLLNQKFVQTCGYTPSIKSLKSTVLFSGRVLIIINLYHMKTFYVFEKLDHSVLSKCQLMECTV